MKKEKTIIGILIILAIVLYQFQFVLFSLKTPKGMSYLGTVHWSGDYFYYLSQFAQGKTRIMSGYDLYTGDFNQPTYVGWLNVFLGHIFYLSGIAQIPAYYLSVYLLTILFMAASYFLVREIFPEDGKRRITAFIFFLAGNTFPVMSFVKNRLNFSYTDFWFNNGNPFNRYVMVPHQMAERFLVIAILLVSFRWWKRNGSLGTAALLLLFSFILAGVEPVHWVLTGAVLFMTALILSAQQLLKSYRRVLKNGHGTVKMKMFAPGVLVALGGWPIALYLKNIFTIAPYVQLANWEAGQSLHISLLIFILGGGPVTLLGLTGMIFFWRRITAERLTIILFTALSIILFYSPIPNLVRIVNVRFLPVAISLFLSCMAADAVFRFSRVAGKYHRLTVGLLILAALLIMLPAYIKEAGEKADIGTNNSFYYVPDEAIAAYNRAEKISKETDTFLVLWPFNWSFPAISGRHVYHGHPLLTINYADKDARAYSFFSGGMNRNDMEKFIRDNKISFVIAYPWSPNVASLPDLEQIYRNRLLVIYRAF